MMQASPTRPHERELRVASGAMVAIAAAWPILPLHPQVACPLRVATGVPCPFCGITRAVVAAAHGHAGQSLAFNPGGIILLLVAVVALLRPAWLARLQVPTWSLLAIIGALWLWNIGFNPTFHQLLVP